MSTASGGPMRAAVTRRWEQIEVDTVAIPEPGPGQVLIDPTRD